MHKYKLKLYQNPPEELIKKIDDYFINSRDGISNIIEWKNNNYMLPIRKNKKY